VAVVVSEPLVVSDQKVIVINPSHLQIVGIIRVSWAGEHPRGENATPVTDLDCCDVVIDNQWAHGPSDHGDVFAIRGVRHRTAYGRGIHCPKEPCKQDRAKYHAHRRPPQSDSSQPRTRQMLRATEGDEEEGQEKSEEHNPNE
jgi:hypothetical protein